MSQDTMISEQVLNYEIDYSPASRLGKGSYGDVYKARNTVTGENVAVKVLNVVKLREKGYTFKRIQDEINCMKETMKNYTNGNPNIVRFYDVAMRENQVFIFEELCQGGSLQSMIYKNGPLQEKYCRKFLRQIIEGVRFLHLRNIAHRDLKPENLMLTTSNKETAVIKIIDFGLARDLSGSNLGGTMCGSPGYIAPEVFFAQETKYTVKVDLWSVGAILYNMITGRKVAFNNVKKCFETLPPHVTSECKEVLQGLLKRNPADRMSCEDILNHPYLLPPRPSLYEGGDGFAETTENLSINMKTAEKLSAPIEQDNFLSYQPSVAQPYVDPMLSPIKSGSTSLDFDDSIFTRQKESMKNMSSVADASVLKEHMAGKVSCENTGITSKSELNDMEQVEEDQCDGVSDDSIQDDWSMVELTEEEKVETFKRGYISDVNNENSSKAPSYTNSTSSVFKSNALEVFQAEDNDVSLPNMKDDKYVNGARNNCPSGSTQDSDACVHTLNFNEYDVMSCNENMLERKKGKKNNFSSDENSASCSNVSDVSSSQIEARDGGDDAERETSLLYPQNDIAKRVMNASLGKPESPMLVVEDMAKTTQTMSRVASDDNYRNGIWSMTYKSFQVGDAALFIKNTQYENIYTMFQHEATHPVFLNEDCMDIFKKYFLTATTKTLPNVVSGRIILIEDNQIATRHDNPYHLPNSGDVFGTVTVERLTESIVRNIEPSPNRSFSSDFIATGTTNLFVLRANDGVQKGIYIMLRYTDKNGSDGIPYFLDLECVAAINNQTKYVPNYILGEVICIEERVASGNDQWGVKAGERYGLCTVAPL